MSNINLIQPVLTSRRFAVSEKGFVTSEIMIAWIQKEFNDQMKEKASNEYRLLFLDGHSSHQTLEIINFCMESKIVLMAFPPHTTHALQHE